MGMLLGVAFSISGIPKRLFLLLSSSQCSG